jgi:lipoprotein-anchoring transpeptidase ErfK/SrfK
VDSPSAGSPPLAPGPTRPGVWGGGEPKARRLKDAVAVPMLGRMREGESLRRWMPAAVLAAGVVVGGLASAGRIDTALAEDPVAATSPVPSGPIESEPGAPARRTGGFGYLRAEPRSIDDAREGNPRGRAEHRPPPGRHVLVHVPRDMAMTAHPDGGRVVGVLPGTSRYYDEPTVAWIQRLSSDGRFGRLAVPYTASSRSGWIPLSGLRDSWSPIEVHVSLSRHELVVRRRGSVLFRAASATGTPSSPTPRGRYFVTDRVGFPSGGYLGRFAFGLSGIQPRLPPGWTGGDQLAIHGTNDPSSIGRSASAGCVRVAHGTVRRLRPLLRLGTPVIIRP